MDEVARPGVLTYLLFGCGLVVFLAFVGLIAAGMLACQDPLQVQYERELSRAEASQRHALHEQRIVEIMRGMERLSQEQLPKELDAETPLAYSRLLAVDIESIDDVRGWLVTVTSRLCIDRLRAHERVKRAYVGPWLPEPIVDAASADVDLADRITLDDTVRMALIVDASLFRGNRQPNLPKTSKAAWVASSTRP